MANHAFCCCVSVLCRTNLCGAQGSSTAVRMCRCVVSPSSSLALRSAAMPRLWTEVKTPVGQLQQCGGRSSTPLHWDACIRPPIEEGYAPSTTFQKVLCRTPSSTVSAGHVPSARNIGRFITGALVRNSGARVLSRLPLSNSTSPRMQWRGSLFFNKSRPSSIDWEFEYYWLRNVQGCWIMWVEDSVKRILVVSFSPPKSLLSCR